MEIEMDTEIEEKTLELDWNKLLHGKDEGHPPELVVVGGRNKKEPPQPPQPSPLSLKDDLRQMPDHVISDTISRLIGKLDSISPRLPDKGVKLRERLMRYLEEQERRNLLRYEKEQTVVLVDEEDCQLIETTQQEDIPLERMKQAKIDYPSRDDSEPFELCHSDIECLAPEAYLSSTIMNFYISYLQRSVSATGKSRVDYHFFNTYFYEKLKAAVSYKRSDKDAEFARLRRWWKGVNIFQKAYILLPIHEKNHWSLVIICIPDKEDESGPTLLHLDSLGYHNSCQIFENIKRFLEYEWNYINQGVVPPDLPIADKIITVPQQKNDYDCGIFVLLFMERFIEEAPQRLKKRDLAMFGRQWFKPEEASGLRERIHILLVEEFSKF